MTRRTFHNSLVLIAALFAFVWAVVRARVQSITMDEADTYFWWVSTSNVWTFFPNNHVLNSLLMWISTRAFGPSILAIRTPALLGAILYIGACYFLCRAIADRFSIQLPLFVCLIYNPFVFDYMVVARGYGIANALLLTAIAVPAWYRLKQPPMLRRSCALASLALGLSFTANFSFAFVDLAVLLAILTWAIWQRGQESVTRIVAYCALPGLCAVLLVCGYPLAHWKRDDLTWGTDSLGSMTQSLVDASLYQLDPRFRETPWYAAMDFLGHWLLPVLVILCVGQLVATTLDGSWLQDARARWLGRFAAALAAIVTLCVLLHWMAFRIEKLPLPFGRTGIFLVPLTTLLAGTIAAAPARSLISRWFRRGLAAAFLCLACYFVSCMRLSYFREYHWDADAKEVYSVLAKYNHNYGVTDVGMTGLFFPALNYYRMLSKNETFLAFKADPNPPVGKYIYVMSDLVDRSFIDKEKLVIVYRGNFSDVVVAVRP